jgi:hypothetical protein
MKKNLLLALMVATFVMLGSKAAQAVNLSWVDSNRTVIVENTVQVTKPSTKWDTQTKHYEDPAPVKWVRHIDGANPQMFLRYSANVKGRTAHDYAKLIVKNELAARGITVTGVQNKVINNRHVAVINGTKDNERYMIGVWRHRDIGFQLECKAELNKFDNFMGEFDQAINSVQIVKEQGL